MIRSEDLDERRLFTYEERKATLARARNKCACCGKPLTTKNMTMDHVIPISRGGKNTPENLVPLCYDCNQLKGNFLYRPESFYISAMNESMYVECQSTFHEWFDSIYKDFPIKNYPMISPKFLTLFIPKGIRPMSKKPIITRQLMLEWNFIGKDWEDEAFAITGQIMNEIRSDTNMLTYGKYRGEIVAIYALKKLTSYKYLSLTSVLLDEERHKLTVYMPWSDISDDFEPTVLYFFVEFLLESLVEYAHVQIDMVNIFAKSRNALMHFYNGSHHSVLGIGCNNITELNVKGIGTVYETDILRHIYVDEDREIKLGFDANGHRVQNAMELKDNSDILMNKLNDAIKIANERYDAAHENSNVKETFIDEC